MLSLCSDVFSAIFTKTPPDDFVRFSATCRQAAAACQQFITGHYPVTVERYGGTESELRHRIAMSFTCPCGNIGWDVRLICSCWVTCAQCDRHLPIDMTKQYVLNSELIRVCKQPCHLNA